MLMRLVVLVIGNWTSTTWIESSKNSFLQSNLAEKHVCSFSIFILFLVLISSMFRYSSLVIFLFFLINAEVLIKSAER